MTILSKNKACLLSIALSLSLYNHPSLNAMEKDLRSPARAHASPVLVQVAQKASAATSNQKKIFQIYILAGILQQHREMQALWLRLRQKLTDRLSYQQCSEEEKSQIREELANITRGLYFAQEAKRRLIERWNPSEKEAQPVF